MSNNKSVPTCLEPMLMINVGFFLVYRQPADGSSKTVIKLPEHLVMAKPALCANKCGERTNTGSAAWNTERTQTSDLELNVLICLLCAQLVCMNQHREHTSARQIAQLMAKKQFYIFLSQWLRLISLLPASFTLPCTAVYCTREWEVEGSR